MKKKVVQLLLLITICSLFLIGCRKEELNQDSRLGYVTDFSEIEDDEYGEKGSKNLIEETSNTGETSNAGNGLIIGNVSKDDISAIGDVELEELLIEEGPLLGFWDYYYISPVKEDGTFKEITKISTYEEQENFLKLRPEAEEVFGFKEIFYENSSVYIIHILEPKLKESVLASQARLINETLLIDGYYKQIYRESLPFESAYLTLTIDDKEGADIDNVKFRIEGVSQEELREMNKKRLEKINKAKEPEVLKEEIE